MKKINLSDPKEEKSGIWAKIGFTEITQDTYLQVGYGLFDHV